jgi:tRNA (guanine26-N2/guanine27-N2)-dimethyltransferase
MEPLLSLLIGFSARVFVRITKLAENLKFLARKTIVTNNYDTGYQAWTTQTLGKNKLVKDKNGKNFFWKHVPQQRFATTSTLLIPLSNCLAFSQPPAADIP